MFQYGYWVWKKALSPQVCDYIINEVPKDKLNQESQKKRYRHAQRGEIFFEADFLLFVFE